MSTPPFQMASFNAFALAYAQSDFFGKLIFLGLFVLSAICWIVLLQKGISTRRLRSISLGFRQMLESSKDRLLSLDAKDFPMGLGHPFAEIFTSLRDKTLEVLNKNHFFASQQRGRDESQVYLSLADLQLVESYVLTTISVESKKIEKNIYILSTIVTLAPFLGLLGTVWGILVTFSELHSGGSISSNSAILGGISTALATTVLGLVIAIPALIAYNSLKNSVRLFTSEMEDFLSSLIATIELQYRKADVS